MTPIAASLQKVPSSARVRPPKFLTIPGSRTSFSARPSPPERLLIGRGKPTSRRQRITKRPVITQLRLRHSSPFVRGRGLSKFLNDVEEILPANNYVQDIDRFMASLRFCCKHRRRRSYFSVEINFQRNKDDPEERYLIRELFLAILRSRFFPRNRCHFRRRSRKEEEKEENRKNRVKMKLQNCRTTLSAIFYRSLISTAFARVKVYVVMLQKRVELRKKVAPAATPCTVSNQGRLPIAAEKLTQTMHVVYVSLTFHFVLGWFPRERSNWWTAISKRTQLSGKSRPLHLAITVSLPFKHSCAKGFLNENVFPISTVEKLSPNLP